MTDWIEFAAALAVFFASHLLPARPGVREKLLPGRREREPGEHQRDGASVAQTGNPCAQASTEHIPCQPQRQGGEQDPAGFADETGKPGLQGRRAVAHVARRTG